MKIDESLVETYERDGAVCLRSMVSGEFLEGAQAAFNDILRTESREPEVAPYFSRQRVWEWEPRLRAVCLDSRLPEAAAILMRATAVNLLYDQAFIKRPGSNARTAWHNDLPNWPFRGSQMVTLWVALDTIGVSTGTLEFVRGSHVWNRWYPPFYTDVDGRLTGLHATAHEPQFDQHPPDIEADRESYDIVSWELEPGDVVAFNALTVHGATGHASTKTQRRGYSIRYAGPDVRYYSGEVRNVTISCPTLHTGDRLVATQYPLAYSQSPVS